MAQSNRSKATQGFDLVVIGAGPGGYIAAIRAAQLGMRVACVEKETPLGGTCLNIGCIPSKALLDSSEIYYQTKHQFAAHGVLVRDVELDLPALMARKERVVKVLTQGIAGLFKKHGIERVHGVARIAAPGRVVVNSNGSERELTASRILIATGSVPAALPGLPFDGERIVSSTEALAFTQVPRKLLVVGAGAVGLELGSVWSRLGAEVLVVEFLDRILPGMDRKLAELLHKSLQRQGLRIQLQTTARSAEPVENGVRVTLDQRGQTSVVEVDRVLVAVGRRPYTDGLGLEALGVERDRRGFITVDENYQTSVPGIYAIGDVIPGPMLAHKAEEEGVAAVERMNGIAGHVNYDAVPNVVYTAPELAGVGLTEEAAQERGLDVRVGTFPFLANGRARCLGETDGQVKVIADAKTDRILGVHILGPRASDLIAEAALAIEFGASAEDLARTCHAHPTLPEALREAALAVDGRPLNI
ncbi:MAG: dihydrolipoyl dehydrogenase [Candidatus Binatia bacterium]|nr:dihydrolipoyl dehydrogenase [Candidatus Binatia bacterium]